jgi:hypothetical protein
MWNERPSLAELREMTVVELRAQAKAMAQEATGYCPHCEQEMWRLYRRPLNKGMVEFLVRLAERTHDGRWVHFSDVGFTSRDYPYLSWWGLAETLRSDEDDKVWSGSWRVTKLGLDFVLDHTTTVPSHMFHVSHVGREKAVVGWETSRVSILQVQRFNFMELMADGSLPELHEMYRAERVPKPRWPRREVKKFQMPLFRAVK